MIPPSGPSNARIMLVGEAPGEQEMIRRAPFVGASGYELDRMLQDAGIMRGECFVTNVARERPPQNDVEVWLPKAKKDIQPNFVNVRGRLVHPIIAAGVEMLRDEIRMVRPNVIVAFGNTPLWALTGRIGVKSWRGSTLLSDLAGAEGVKVIPAYHPAYVLRDWSARAITVQDLRRVRAAAASPDYVPPDNAFIIRPNIDITLRHLRSLLTLLAAGPLTLSVDIETRSGHIACLGLAHNRRDALCIPFMCVERPAGYWTPEEEAAVLAALFEVLCHPNAQVVGQNFIYDAQYIYRHWGFVPNFSRDTMLAHHTCYPGTPKGLDYLSSMYCEHHVYWKDESKDWDPKVGEDQLWTYNCKDCVITFEVDEVLQRQVDTLGLREQHDFQQSMFWPALETMIRGVRSDQKRRGEFSLLLAEEQAKREQFFLDALGHPLNPASPVAMKRLFYEDLQQKPIISRKTGQITLDDEAIKTLAKREPLLRPLVRNISEYRSLGVFQSTFVGAPLDLDHRIRCSYNIAGTETFRFSSSKNAFGSGLNLQNVPKGGETDKSDPDALHLPNVRTLFIPDPGFTFFDGDLSGADAQVVAWEADDVELKAMLLEGADLHSENAKLLGISRQLAKVWVHGTNYGGGERTMSANCGISVHEAGRLRNRWFAAHPGIKRWHERTEAALRGQRFVQNIFGYRRYYFDRVEGLLPEALAWQPQSTVAIVTNRIWKRIYDNVKDVQILLQVHDSLAGQFPTYLTSFCKERILYEASQVVVPYPDPLVIPFKVKTSPVSWGDCE